MNGVETAQFRAISGETQGFGETPQDALAALMALLGGVSAAPIMIWSFNRGDLFFTDAQQARLETLKRKRDTLTPAEREEWESLVEASFDATVVRTQTLPSVKS